MSRNMATRCRATTRASASVASLIAIPSDISRSGASRCSLPAEGAMVTAVAEVYHEPDRQPHDQAQPGVDTQREHEAEAGQRAEDGDQRDQGRLEGPLEIGTGFPEYPH